MATSGTTAFTLTRNELVEEALSIIGVYSPGETISAADMQASVRALNIMIKALNNEGVLLWTEEEGVCFLNVGQQSYELGPTGAHASKTYVKTELAEDASSGDYEITVDSDAGISEGDYIGIELDDGTLQWTIVEGEPTDDVVMLTDALTDDANEDGNVYAYTTIIDRPERIIDARSVEDGGNEIPIPITSREEYFNMPIKSSQGIPTQCYYDRQLVNGVLYIWPTADSVKKLFKFTWERKIEDAGDAADNPDFPVNALEMLSYMLATRLASRFKVPLQERQAIDMAATSAKHLFMSFNQEVGPFRIMPNYHGRR